MVLPKKIGENFGQFLLQLHPYAEQIIATLVFKNSAKKSLKIAESAGHHIAP
jgi:hypothetical protein